MFIAAQELRAHGYHEESKMTIKRSLEWYKSNPAIKHRFYFAQAYYIAEQWEKAERIILLLLDEDPGNMDYKAYIGLIAARKGDAGKAEEISDFLAEIEPLPVNGRNTCYRARIAAVLGEKEKAVQLLQTTFSQGMENWYFDVYLPELMDFESLRDYPPFVELFEPS
jgi:predicted Zn-dependent protease